MSRWNREGWGPERGPYPSVKKKLSGREGKMQSLMITTMESEGIRSYTFECHDAGRAAYIVAETVRNLDAQGGTLVTVETV